MDFDRPKNRRDFSDKVVNKEKPKKDNRLQGPVRLSREPETSFDRKIGGSAEQMGLIERQKCGLTSIIAASR
jgi:hypothetical protein